MSMWAVLLTAVAHLLASMVCIVLLAGYAMPMGSITAVQSSSYFHLAMAAVTYPVLRFFVVAPFGRHAATTTVRLALPASLSWALQECPTLLNVVYYILVEYPCHALNCSSGEWLRLVARDPLGRVAAVVAKGFGTLHIGLVFFVLHYVHRSLLYPLRVRQGTPVPVHVTLSATLYCIFNGRLQLLANIRENETEPRLPITSLWRMLLCIIGVAVFLAGMWVNIASDYYLLRLKSQLPRRAYKVPHGGWFEYVSCANFFGEIVEWCGYALLVWAAKPEAGLAACSFFVYVVANLLPRGLAHHEWYQKQFGDAYAALRRRAVVPCVY
ncbi:3-oxo-5-alpha-steroid 4-dehydrogenase [Trypanosoma grayi]|uniref:3-oxo-5-alpha-steroid 4-dehydrogenase n=1 Tax=Trypanosoma grayi TaxID=71804 RepID=UPI0004F46719|nr:3-oxo-5-alpha-steroid 4-dehydrogenase [Trypanosoma grayi]KEG09610.1 3-oxo-5-alpha-steroid 4-dehydrogenase [Trypanosoma grayi]